MDTVVISGTTYYYYVVTAVNSIGESSYSNEEVATFSIPSDTTTATVSEPGAPSITSFPRFLPLSLFLGILVLVRGRFKRK